MKKRAACQLALSGVSPMLASMMMCLVILPVFGGLLKSDYGIVITQMAFLMIFVLMLYFPFYRRGIEDSRLAKSEEVNRDLSKGARAGLLLSLILYISVAFLILMKIRLMPDMIFVYKILNPQFTGILHYLIPNNTIAEVREPQILCSVLLPLIVPAVTGTAYYIGGKASDRNTFPR